MERGEQLWDACWGERYRQWEKAMELLDGCSERDVNWKDGAGRTPLMWACREGAPLDMLNKMEERGADIHAVNDVSREGGRVQGCVHVY